MRMVNTGGNRDLLKQFYKRTAINKACKELCSGIQIKSCDITLPAIRFMEHMACMAL
jgi:hypothetical protein